MSAFDVDDTVDGDSAGEHCVIDRVWALNKARLVRTGNKTKSTKSQFQFRTSSNVEYSLGLGASVQINWHREKSGVTSADGVNVTQIIAIFMFLFVKKVDPAMETNNWVIREPLKNIGVFPSTASYNTFDKMSITTKPDLIEVLFESCIVNSIGVT